MSSLSRLGTWTHSTWSNMEPQQRAWAQGGWHCVQEDRQHRSKRGAGYSRGSGLGGESTGFWAVWPWAGHLTSLGLRAPTDIETMLSTALAPCVVHSQYMTALLTLCFHSSHGDQFHIQQTFLQGWLYQAPGTRTHTHTHTSNLWARDWQAGF